MNPVLVATFTLLGLGLAASIVLVIASRIFYVWEDPKIEAVEGALLGANCGGCGYAGCAAAARAVVEGKAGADICVAGGFSIAVAVARVMGLEVKAKEPEISLPGCRYSTSEAALKFNYNGFADCRAATLLYGGSKVCTVGCLGLGTCAVACPFGAIRMQGALPVVDPALCTGCGVCEKICPKHIITLSSNTLRMTSEYTAGECTAPCQRACPAGINIPKYIQAIASGRFDEAVRVMREKNPMLLVCGRICPAPCEVECRRNLADQPLAINPLKKFAVDYEMQAGKRVETFKAPESGKRVAVIGGGTQGLTLAYYLARLGHSPEIFEAMPKLGGILRYVITRDRLPENVLDFEIQGILETGVKAHTGKVFGRDVTLGSLISQGFDAVVCTTGGMDARKVIRGPKTAETSVPGIILLVDLLTAGMRGEQPALGQNVCLVDPGEPEEAASDLLKILGARHITVLSDAEVAGLRGNGKGVTEVTVVQGGNKKSMKADTVVLALGRLPELVFAPVKGDGGTGAWETVPVFQGYSENRAPGVFGTVEPGRVSDYTAVVRAVGAGRKLARQVHRHLSGDPIEPQKNLAAESRAVQNLHRVDDLDIIPRNMPLNLGKSGKSGLEVPLTDLGYTKELAVKEAARCLDCGLICYTRVKAKS